MYWINKAVWFVSNPMTVGLVLLLLALLSRKIRRTCLLVALIVFSVLSSGWFSQLIGYSLEKDYPQTRPTDFPCADLIIELGGGIGNGKNNATGYPELSSGADRVYLASLLWKAGKAPFVLFTSVGITNKDYIVARDFGVPEDAMICEPDSLTTEENVKFSRRMMREKGLIDSNHRTRVLLVTSAWHMKRSLFMFEKYAPELECIPAASDYESLARDELNFRDFIPDPSAFERNCRFLHEWLGIIGYHLRK